VTAGQDECRNTFFASVLLTLCWIAITSLKNQEIYFSPPEQLNDPVEGFKDIFWQGDGIVWTNLLRHYLLCLMQATSITAMTGKDFTPDLYSTLVHQTRRRPTLAPIRDIYATICGDFLSHDASKSLVASLSSQSKAVRRDELIFYLRLLFALRHSGHRRAIPASRRVDPADAASVAIGLPNGLTDRSPFDVIFELVEAN